MESSEETHDFYCAPDAFSSVQKALEDQLGEPQEARLAWKPQNFIEVDQGKAESLIKMIDTMEDLDDVQAVFTNFDASDEIMQNLAAAS